jgi:hypothetical protein
MLEWFVLVFIIDKKSLEGKQKVDGKLKSPD